MSREDHLQEHVQVPVRGEPDPAAPGRNGVRPDATDDQALVLAEAAAGTYRQLAEADPQTYLPHLARALTDLGTLRSRVNWELALPPAREATEIYRQLTQSDLRVLPDVAGALSNLLTFLTEMGSCAGMTGPVGPSATPVAAQMA